MQEKNRQDGPIGIFDSGVGGLCVLKEVRKHLPLESIVYFADSGNCPYGSKSGEEILFLAEKRIRFLLDKGCKLIVVACNTITAVAIETFRARYAVPFIGMEPALKPAALRTQTKKIGILATENTFNGKLFQKTYERHAGGIEVFVQPGFGLVELVEKGEEDGETARTLLKRYLMPMLEKGVDTIVLGCTHYPFLRAAIASVTQNRMEIIDSSDAVAAQTRRIMEQFDLIGPAEQAPKFCFYTTGNLKMTERFLSRLMDKPFELEQIDG